MSRLLLSHGADPDLPGWMWNSARYDAEQLVGDVRAQMDALLAFDPLQSLTDSGHHTEVERQLLADLVHHGIRDVSLGWSSAAPNGETVQVRGERLAPFAGVSLLDAQGTVVGSGDFDFLVLTVEIDFRVFWTRVDLNGTRIEPGGGDIPAHVWAGMTANQRLWLPKDQRNKWRSNRIYRLRVEGGRHAK